jgi:hypothetical protein
MAQIGSVWVSTSWADSWAANTWAGGAPVIPGPTINYQGQGDGDAGRKKKRRRTHELFEEMEATLRRIMAGSPAAVDAVLEPAARDLRGLGISEQDLRGGQPEPDALVQELEGLSVDDPVLSRRLAQLETDLQRYKESLRQARDEEEAEEMMMFL